MAAFIQFNPNLTTNAQNSFSLDTDGVMQGTMPNHPAKTPADIRAGLVSSTNTAPLYGGLPVVADLPTGGASVTGHSPLVLTLATTTAGISGITIFDLATNGLIVPGGDNAPLYGQGMTINWLALGSGAPVVLQASTALVDALGGTSATGSNLASWNFTTNVLDVYNSTTGAFPLKTIDRVYTTNSLVVTYSSTTGLYTFTRGPAVVITI